MHGTAVASVVGAKTGNNTGIAGVARNHAVIVPVKVGESTPDCQGRFADTELIANAIGWAAFNADILNMSWGWFQSLPAIQEAIERATLLQENGEVWERCLSQAQATTAEMSLPCPLLWPV